ncbi:flavodoxin-dependent (E)-4-hydroxy-3-methylbut-2-enyl-diphosphate synthase, partial [Fusobacterium sp.]
MRRRSKLLKIGNISMGGDSNIIIQSMTNTNTADIKATITQINELEKAGCQLVRVTVNNLKAAEA